MQQEILFNTCDDPESIGQLKFNTHPHKKYVLTKILPIQKHNAQKLPKQEKKKKKQDARTSQSQYFTNILKEQKRNLFINTFIRKLKNSIILRKPPEHHFLSNSNQENIQQDQLQIHFPKLFELTLLFIWAFHTFALMILNSMALIFDEVDRSQIFQNFMIFSFLVHLVEMGSRFVIHLDYQENKLTKVRQITQKYFQKQFWEDFIVLFGLTMFFILDRNDGVGSIFRFLIFVKIKSLLYIVEHLEITLIQSVYREQIWALIKVFIFNFTFAHILSLLLVLMARIQTDDNWLINRNLNDKQFTEIYIWAYYWATTIMLTVGFGDITPRNSKEALCMIVIEMTSCILLAYNINRVGTIIQKIRSYEDEKKSHLKTFNHLNQKSKFTEEIKTRIMNHIKQSTEIRRNFNLESEKQFIESLPESFQTNMLKEMNRHIWNGMMFFQNLSEETLVKLSIKMEKKLAHPEQIVYMRGNDIDVLVFNGGGFGYAYNNGNSIHNGKIMQYFGVSNDEYKIASLEFMFGKKLKYDIKCTDYALIYKISTEQLIKTLKNQSYDSEYYFMIKDKDKFLLNEYELCECQLCKTTKQKQRHSVFKCPRLHYLPLQQHIINKYKDKYFPKLFHYSNKRGSLKKYRTLLMEKGNRSQNLATKRFIQNYQASKSHKRIQSGGTILSINSMHDVNDDNSKKMNKINGINIQFVEGQIKLQNNGTAQPQSQNKNDQAQESQINIVTTTKFYEQAFDQLKTRLDNIMQPSKFAWDLQLDVAFNYKFYFRKHNSDQLTNINMKRKKKRNLQGTKKFRRTIKQKGMKRIM